MESNVSAVPVSVLLPLYSGDDPRHLEQSLHSMFSQTRPSREIVLVVDGPISAHHELVLNSFTGKNRIPELVIVRLPMNMGLSTALNEGLKHCRYDLVARMDADDISEPNRIERQWAKFCSEPSITLVGAWQAEFNENPDEITAYKTAPHCHYDLVRMLHWRCVISHPTIMFRKEAVLAVGGYKKMPAFEDNDLFLRLARNGGMLSVLPEPLVRVRVTLNQRRRRGGWRIYKTYCRFRYDCFRRGDFSFLKMLFILMVWTPFFLSPPRLKGHLYSLVRKRPDRVAMEDSITDFAKASAQHPVGQAGIGGKINDYRAFPRIAVVMPAYKSVATLRKAVMSVIREAPQNVQVWISVHPRDHDTKSLAEKLCGDRISVLVQDGSGIANARNTILRLIDADFYMFLDSDDEFLPAAFDGDCMQAVSSEREALWYRDYYNVLPSGKRRLKRGRTFTDSQRAYNALCRENFIATGTVIIPRRIVEVVGLFDESLTHAEDWEYWLRIAKMFPIRHFPLPVYQYRHTKLSELKGRGFWLQEIRVVEQQNLPNMIAIFAKVLVHGRYGIYFVRTLHRRRELAFSEPLHPLDMLAVPVALLFKTTRAILIRLRLPLNSTLTSSKIIGS